jgi:hypothetical protein
VDAAVSAFSEGHFFSPSPSANLVGFTEKGTYWSRGRRESAEHVLRALFLSQDEVKTVTRDYEPIRELKNDQHHLKELYLTSHGVGRTWQATVAICGLAGGCLAAILGTLLSAGAWMLGDEANGLSLHGVGTILLLSTIPLLAGGAHCLDLLEKRVKKSGRVNSAGAVEALRLTHSARSHIVTVIALFVLLCEMPSKTQAQQTVFNVPTTDVLDAGKLYFEVDISAKPNEPKFSSFVPRIVVGAGGNVEVGLNVTGNIQPGPDSTTLSPAVKWRVYTGKENGFALVVGNNLFIPVRKRSYRLGTYSYVMAQKTFSTKTRVGCGGYFFSQNVVAVDANRAGGQFTFEQPVNTKLTLAADWFTGRHGAGYFTPGAIFKLSPKVTGYASYSIGNQNATRGNHFFLFEVGYNFN